MKRPIAVLLPALLPVIAAVAHAQDTTAVEPGPWKFTSALGLTLTQSSFSSNWYGGDQGSIVWVLNGDAKAERQLSARVHLSNVL